MQWRRLVREKRSRDTLAVGLGYFGLERKITKIHAGKIDVRENICWQTLRWY